jgi:biotin carboxyl carrier protein
MNDSKQPWAVSIGICLALCALAVMIAIVRGGTASAESEHGHSHAGGGHDHGAAPAAKAPAKLTPQALKNLGVVVAEIKEQPFFKYQAVPAVVTELPSNVHPLYAPLAGRVLDIKVQPGVMVASNTVVIRIVRDAIPRPQLNIVGDVLKPASEEHHTTISELRKTFRHLQLAKEEMARVKQYTESGTQDGLPILPRKNLIDLKYESARLEQDLANSHAELSRHGLSEEQIASIESGKQASVGGAEFWKRALERNNLWPAAAEQTYKALPAEIQQMPWTVAVVGELYASGIGTAQFSEWLGKATEAGAQFHEIAGLLQQGHTLADVQSLFETSALKQIVELRAPVTEGVPDWDVHEVFVSPGQKVEAGAKLLTLDNPRHILLKTTPVGSETTAILKALESDDELEAVPLVAGSGPTLSKLRIDFISSDAESRGTVAFVRAENSPLPVKDRAHGKFRSWALREGQKYMLRVPTQKIQAAFVLPAGAVTDMGADKVVFLQSGENFLPKKVVVLYQDQEQVVLDSSESEIYPDDPIVHHGAFGLGLALSVNTAGASAGHAGHAH